MRMHRIKTVSLFVLAYAASASAQEGQQGQQAQQGQQGQQTPQESTSSAAASDASKIRPLSTEELVAQGEAVVRRGVTESQAVRTMLDDARKEADIIKITCLDDKLTQINVNLRTAEARLDALRKTVDPDRRLHEYTVLTVLGQKLQVLDQEAHQCVGQSMYETGATKVVTEIDNSMMPFEQNPSNLPVIVPPGGSTVPPPASGQK